MSFRGLPNLYSPSLAGSLLMVLTQLVHRPFELMATCGLRLLALKVAFTVAIMSAQRASEFLARR